MLHKTLTLLDTRGLMLRDFHGSQYKSATNDADKPIATWQEGLGEFVERTLIPALASGVAPLDMIACWDAGNQYRLNLFSGYKEKRRSKPKDVKASKEIGQLKDKLIHLLAYLGIRSVYVPGEEADDLIALLASRVSAGHVIVRTKDADLLQLVSPRCSVWLDKEFHCVEMPLNREVPPELTVIYKTLVGDSSDEYGGVPLLGPKGFSNLREAYGNDGLLQIHGYLEANDLEGFKGVVASTGDATLQKIVTHWDQARLCLKLATLNPQACYGMAEGRRPKRPIWTARVPNREKVLAILNDIGMGKAISHFEHLFPRHRLLTAADSEQLPFIAQEILASPVVSWDYESTDKLKHPAFKQAKKNQKKGSGYVDVLSQEIAGVSINYGQFAEKTIYVPFDHRDTDNFGKEWMVWLLQVLDSHPSRTVVQNANFELTLSKTNLDYMPKAPIDTAILSAYVDENEESGLKSMSLRYLGYTQTTYQEVTQGRDMCDLTGEEVLNYGCDDSLVTTHLYVLFRTIMECEGSWSFYASNEVEPAVNDVLDFIDGQEIDYPLMAKFKAESLSEISLANAKLRSLLEEHVGTLVDDFTVEKARRLHEEWMQPVQVRYADNKEMLEKKRQELWERAWSYCFYEPLSITVRIPDFVATPTLLNKVIAGIDPEAPKIAKANGPGVEDLEARMAEYIGNPRTSPRASEDLEQFMSLLYSARKKLSASARSGAEYQALADFCQARLNLVGGGKEIRMGDELQTNSVDQMQGLLYGKLGLQVRRRSKVTRGSLRDSAGLKGAAGTGLKAIAAAYVYDLPEGDDWRKDVLSAYKTIVLEQQNQSLYYHSYPLWKHPRDGRIHPQIRNCGTTTRRPAGNDPNVLQVSKKEGGKIRKVFGAGDYGDGTRVVVSADFSNQELVITGCEARDPVMLDAFMSSPRKDLHSLTSTGYAHILLPRLGVPWSDGPMDYEKFMSCRKGKLETATTSAKELANAVNQIRNKYSKAVNFLIAYLGGYTTLAENLLIPKELSKELMESTFRMYPRLKPWQEETIEFARTHGYTQTAYGNRRHASPNLYSSEDGLRTREERQLVNATIQGCAADILKIVRQKFIDRGIRDKYRVRAVKPVYDEMTGSVPIEAVADYCEELVEMMSVTPPGYPVGMAVEISIGKTWGDQLEVKGTSREAVEETLQEVLSSE